MILTGDTRPRIPHDHCDLRLLLGGLREDRDGQVERPREARDLASPIPPRVLPVYRAYSPT
jgi:hypothetical protein